MENRPPTTASSPKLADLFEGIVATVQAGRDVDIDRIERDYPQWVDEIKDLVPAVHAMVQLEQAAQPAAKGPLTEGGVVETEGVLGDFRLLREIGRGGMGVVYEARQISLSRRVALKMLPLAAVIDERRIRRFHNEAKMAATLKHPHIVSVFAVGCERGVHYYAMELVDGHSLSEVIRRVQDEHGQQRPVPTSQDTTRAIAALSTQWTTNRKQYYQHMARLVADVADALDYAHREGIVHRDIKPSNILLDNHGKAWVTDFGLAQMRGDGSLTLTGDVLGTARYMSPEQATGQRVVDQRTDIYSLGITFYELLTLRPAFDGSEYHVVLNAVVEKDPPPLRRVDPSIPADLGTIVQKATGKSADMRYATAQELADDLRRFLDSKPIQARRCGRAELLLRWAKRKPAAAGLIAAIAFLLLALAVTSTVFSVHLARVAGQTAARLYISEMNHAQAALDRGDALACEEILLRYVPSGSGEKDERGFEWFYLWDQSHRGTAPKVLRHGLDVACVTYSDDGQTLATGCWGGRVRLWDRSTKAPLGVLEKSGSIHRRSVMGLSFVDQDTAIVSASLDAYIRKWDVASQSELYTIDTNEDRWLLDMSMAPNENLVAVAHGILPARLPASASGRVAVWDLRSRNRLARFDDLVGLPSVAFSPNGRVLAIADQSGKLRTVDTTTWTVRETIEAHQAAILDLAYSPRGQILATASGVWHDRFVAGEVKLWDASSWVERNVLRDHTNAIRCVAFSYDGQCLAAGSRDRGISLWEVAAGRLITSFPAHSQTVLDVAFSPDGAELSSTSVDATCRVWKLSDLVESPAEPTVLDDVEGHKNSIAITHDGRTICYATCTGTIDVRDTVTGRVRFRIEKTIINSMPDVAISPDDQFLVVVWGAWPVDQTHPPEMNLYRLADGQLIRRFETKYPFNRGVAFSPSGKSVAVSFVDHLVVWNVASGKQTGEVGPIDGFMKCVRFHPHKPLLACTTDAGITYFLRTDPLTLGDSPLRTGQRATMSMDFSPDGKSFVTGGVDRVIQLWDTETRRRLRAFQKAPDIVNSVRFSHDGQRVLAGLRDGTVSLWHVGTGQSLLTLQVGDPSYWTMCGEFSGDDSVIVSASLPVRVWRRGDRWKAIQRLTIQTIPPECHGE